MLGQVSCVGETFVWGKSPVWVKLFALLPDGQEQSVNSTPIAVAPP